MISIATMGLGWVLLLSVCAQAGAQDTGPRLRTLELGTFEDVDFRLRVRSEASPADIGWVGFEFVRGGESWPEMIASFGFSRIDVFNDSGRRLYWTAGGPRQVRHLEEFNPAEHSILVASELRDAVLSGLRAHRGPVVIAAEVSLSLTSVTGPSRRVQSPMLVVHWTPPTAEDFESMRRELRSRFEGMKENWDGNIDAVRAHLRWPEVASELSVDELLRVVADPKPRSHREAFLKHLREHHRPALLDAYETRLKEGDLSALRDLHSGLWRDDFGELLLALHLQDPMPSAARWPVEAFVGYPGHDKRDQHLARQFVGPLIQSAGTLDPAALERDKVRDVAYWKRVFRAIGALNDASALAYLSSFLSDERLLVDPEETRNLSAAPWTPVPEPLRLCDFAHDAILRILEPDNDSYHEYFRDDWRRWNEQQGEAGTRRRRDELVKRLEQRLAAMQNRGPGR